MKKHNKWQPARLGLYTQAIVKPVFKTRGLMEGKIITHWMHIVGERYARLSLPEKITFPKGKKDEGTLHLNVTSSGSLLIHYAQGLILEHVNTFFGYKAIEKIRMNHSDSLFKQEPTKVPPPPVSGEQKEWIEGQTQSIIDLELKQSLERLGEVICR